VLNSLKKLAGQTAIYGVSSIVGRFLNYLLTPFWTRVFLVGQFGVITEMYAYVAFLVVFLTYGMETTFFKFINRKGANKETVFSTILVSVVATSATFIVISTVFSQSLADWLMYPDHKEYIVWFAIIVGVDAISSIPLAKLRQQNKAIRFVTVNFANVLVNIALNLFFLVYCKGIFDQGETNFLVDTFYNPEIGVGYVFVANLVASLVKFLVMIPDMMSVKMVFDRQLYRKMIPFTIPLLFVGLAGIINETLDRILLKSLLVKDLGWDKTMIQLGIYGANYKLAMIITMFIQAYRYAAEPFFFNEERKSGSKKMFADIMTYFVIVVSSMFLVVVLYLDDLFKYFMHEDFWPGLKVVPVLLLANISFGIFTNLAIWYKLSSKTGFGALISIFGAVVTIVLNIILIPIYGYMGSAWATLVCYFLMMVVSYRLGQKHYPIPYNIKKAGLYVGLAVAIYFIFVHVQNVTETNFALSTLLLLIYLVAVYVIEQKKLFNN
jgi:O-antigen/teichoic acid export membrane protein